MNFLHDTFMNVYKKRLYPNYWDIIAFAFAVGLLFLFAATAKQMDTPYHLGQTIEISLSPIYLPMYALRTVLRIFIALFFSLLFTLLIGTLAAKKERAARLLIPLIDILQS